MANDIIFKKKAFGGFDKEDVMNYVNTLLQEKNQVEKRLAESEAKNAELNADMLQYKKIADESVGLGEELSEMKLRVDELTASIVDKNIEIASANERIQAKNTEIAELQAKLNEAKVSEDVQNEIDALRAEISRLKMELDKKRDMERQVGAAMLDARVHSEELVEQAKGRANQVTKSVYNAIGETALRIDDLSGNIGEIARSFAKSVEEVELRIKALTGDMSKTAQLLITESGAIADSESVSGQVVNVNEEYDFSKSGESATEVKFEPAIENDSTEQ